MPRTPRKPILVVIRDNDKINYHPFGMVNIHEIVLPDTEDPIRAMDWAVTQLMAATYYGESGHADVSQLIINTVTNQVGDIIDIAAAIGIAAAEFHKEIG